MLKEPLLHFLLLGGLLYFLNSRYQDQRHQHDREIVIDANRVNLIKQGFKNQTGHTPTDLQLNGMIDAFIKEEVSYREAKKMGLDKDDEIIRRRLSQKFNFLQTDLLNISEPSEEVLRSFYQNNTSLFIQVARVSFSHLYFSTDNSNDSLAKQRAMRVLADINANVRSVTEKADPFPLQSTFALQTLQDIIQNFGDKPIVKALFEVPINQWTGPIRSGYGWHLVSVSQRDSSTLLPYESNKEYIKQQYHEVEKAKANKLSSERLIDNYIIKRDYLQKK
jgi:parvulin-like peptidyl-prolyl isomerase